MFYSVMKVDDPSRAGSSLHAYVVSPPTILAEVPDAASGWATTLRREGPGPTSEFLGGSYGHPDRAAAEESARAELDRYIISLGPRVGKKMLIFGEVTRSRSCPECAERGVVFIVAEGTDPYDNNALVTCAGCGVASRIGDLEVEETDEDMVFDETDEVAFDEVT